MGLGNTVRKTTVIALNTIRTQAACNPRILFDLVQAGFQRAADVLFTVCQRRGVWVVVAAIHEKWKRRDGFQRAMHRHR
jgi:hypothetical protein